MAICKPAIRRTASARDWIIGVRSKAPEKIVYVMQVSEVVPFARYWSDPRYIERRPGKSPVPDNIYRSNARDELVQEPNPIHQYTDARKDLSGRNALISDRFWYFGENSPELPAELKHLIPYARGYSVHINRRKGDEEKLERWLARWPCDIHGAPINATDELREWLSNRQTNLKNPSIRRSASCT